MIVEPPEEPQDEDSDVDESGDYLPLLQIPEELDFAGSFRCPHCQAEYYLLWDERWPTELGPMFCAFCGEDNPGREVDHDDLSR